MEQTPIDGRWPSGELSSYQQSLRDPNVFSVTWELVPGRGAVEKAQEKLIETASEVAARGLIHALTITDNPGGSPALSAEMLGAEIKRLGVEPLVHITCKDKNRNELESLLYGLERAGVRNLLVMSGDYPKAGYRGTPKAVFDLDPVNLMALIADLDRGREVSTGKGSIKLKPAHFHAGVVVSPFKTLEAEQMGQYYKLKKKLAAGGQFIVSQLGFDARKFHELLQVVKLLGYEQTPVVGNIYLLTLNAAKLMNSNGLPGCAVADKLLAEVQSEASSPDKGKVQRLERAAKIYAMLKGMGFAGAHIAGVGMSVDDLQWVIERGEELSPNWQELVRDFDFPQMNGWYYFERDNTTGLNLTTPTSRHGHSRASVGYTAMKALHETMFTKGGPLFETMRAVAKAVDGSPVEGAFTRIEHVIKGLTNDCLYCGDCAMFDSAYLCPQSECAKNQRNGPCGGSSDGFCEKYPGEKQCIYVRAYERLKSHGAEDSLGTAIVPPVDYELDQTSSWINFFLGRDHSAVQQGIAKIDRKSKKKKSGREKK
ncbi:MAG TPA: methylenetetrahydrofolate reductase C-terminal domain-containing protein [Terriglobales bacterium]|nr:methylenetetrahydrofolate reductase C-terminal domain-containing protein [Terriglobales bacterium]